jgi:hypothetical protein
MHCIACAGPQGELSLLPAFLELAMLLPHHNIELHFIGPDVPERLHKKTCRVHLGGGQSATQNQQLHTGGQPGAGVYASVAGQEPAKNLRIPCKWLAISSLHVIACSEQYACISTQQLSWFADLLLFCFCMLWRMCLQATCRSAAGHLVSMMQ